MSIGMFCHEESFTAFGAAFVFAREFVPAFFVGLPDSFFYFFCRGCHVTSFLPLPLFSFPSFSALPFVSVQVFGTREQ